MINLAAIFPIKKFSGVFHRLQWKLTLSYTLVTVIAILILQTINIAIMMVKLPPDLPFPVALFASELNKSAPQVAPFLINTPPDRNALNSWLQQAVQGKAPVPSAQKPAIILFNQKIDEGKKVTDLNSLTEDKKFTFGIKINANDKILYKAKQQNGKDAIRDQIFFDGRGFAFYFGVLTSMTVIDNTGEIVAATSRPKGLKNLLKSNKLSNADTKAIQAALQGQTKLSQLYAKAPNGSLMIVAPITGAAKQVLGALILSIIRPSRPEQFLQALTATVMQNLALTLTFAIFIGIIFGYFTSRGLTKRLNLLTQSTMTWGRGDFTVSIQDHVKDEIGRLGHSLNSMAQEIQNLLCDREKLAVLEERNRLARDLHDSVNQALYGINLYSEAASRLLAAGETGLAGDHLRELRATAQQALREMRSLIFELRPPLLEQEGLVAALQVRLETVEARTGLKTVFEVTGEGRLEPETEKELYWIIQEALNNILKHADAHNITIRLQQYMAKSIIEIIDDGVGFDLDVVQKQGGLGLLNMKERAGRIGATLEISTNPGTGTKITVEVDHP